MLIASLIYFSAYLQCLLANFTQNVILPVDFDRLKEERLEMNKYRSVASCIAQISERELYWKPTVFIKIGENKTKNEKDFTNDIFDQITKNGIPYVAIDPTKNSDLNMTTAGFLFVSYFEDCEALTAFHFDTLESKVKYLIILDVYSQVCEQNFKGVENIIGKYDISIFVKVSEDQYELYTYVPDVDPKTCQIVVHEPLHINTCTEGKLARFGSFPRKVSTNLNKCPFKVGIGSLYPFAMIENRSELQTADPIDMNRVRGMDFEIVKIMTAYFNATLDLYYIYKEEENPYVNTEFLPFIVNGTFEAGVGGLYRIFGTVIEYSGIYASQSVVWIYYAERESKTWENMVMNIDGLYLFIVFYLSYSIVWWLICLFDKQAVSLRSTLLYSWGALVGTTSLQDARSLKQKILNIVYLNMCLHLSVYISIQLYYFLTVSGPPAMFKTNDDLMKSGRVPFLKTLTKYFVKDEKYERFANTSIECSGFHTCSVASFEQKGTTLLLDGYFYPFQAETAVNDEARMLRSVDNLLTVYYEMLIKKDSPLVHMFQKIAASLFEAGITGKLFNEAIGLTIVGKAKIATKNMVASSYACQTGCELSLEQFSGVFYVWGLGCAASCFLFIVEICMKRVFVNQN